jgi:hypothetical protein
MRRLRVGSNVQMGSLCVLLCVLAQAEQRHSISTFLPNRLAQCSCLRLFDSAFRRATSVGQAQFGYSKQAKLPRTILQRTNACAQRQSSHETHHARSRTFKVTLPIGDQQPEFLDSTETLRVFMFPLSLRRVCVCMKRRGFCKPVVPVHIPTHGRTSHRLGRGFRLERHLGVLSSQRGGGARTRRQTPFRSPTSAFHFRTPLKYRNPVNPKI